MTDEQAPPIEQLPPIEEWAADDQPTFMTSSSVPVPPGWTPTSSGPPLTVSRMPRPKAGPAPLPPAQADPAIVAGQAAQATYGARMAAIRDDPALDELARTEAIVAAYEEHNATINALAEDLHGRRGARLAHLQAQIPTGPGIPADASPADAAVLHTAFRAHLDQARNANPERRGQMLSDAVRFGDQVQVRAVLTAVLDGTRDLMQNRLLDAWAAATGNTAMLAELKQLNAEMNGLGPGRAWVAKALGAPQRPNNEIANLPVLLKRAEQAVDQRNRDANRMSYYRN